MLLSVSYVISKYQYGSFLDYTGITSVSEYSKSRKLLFKCIEVPYYGVSHYFTAQVTYVTL